MKGESANKTTIVDQKKLFDLIKYCEMLLDGNNPKITYIHTNNEINDTHKYIVFFVSNIEFLNLSNNNKNIVKFIEK